MSDGMIRMFLTSVIRNLVLIGDSMLPPDASKNALCSSSTAPRMSAKEIICSSVSVRTLKVDQ